MPDQFDPDIPTRYRKLPVTVEAIRYAPGTNCTAVAEFLGDSPDDLTCAEEADHEQTEYAIATLEGVMHASPGDYIIRGVQGYPCKPDIFEATYERADTPVIPGQNPGRPTPEAIAEALIQYETGGMCHFSQTCGLCDCGKADETPEQTQTRDAMDLDRARAVLAVLPAALPSEDEAARAIARASDVEWDYNPEDPEDPYRHDARAVLALIPPQRCVPSEAEVANVLRDILVRVFEQDKDIVAQDAARAVLAPFPPQRCAPTEAEVSDALSESRWRGLGGMTEKQACDYMARAILDLLAAQPTVGEAQAQALRHAARLMRRCKEMGHWNLRDLEDDETWHGPDRWLEVLADAIESGATHG